ncbi:hypothetical protein MACH17_06420 [Phaeobacter inhibens]|uniref:hypothetical protein n=1 Tax=Phaeobacter inhibens TaxID=221822 RepID=UPI00274CEA7A|nr:hypothetical protein [Phaeobacter inhibens]GLO69125.1 hypothetical protein MACH17_06420 [Phaeobacter inhibens]
MIPAADPTISDRGMGKQQNTAFGASHLCLPSVSLVAIGAAPVDKPSHGHWG